MLVRPESIEKLHKLIDEILDTYYPKIYEREIFQSREFKQKKSRYCLDKAFKIIKIIKESDLSFNPNGYFEHIDTYIQKYKEVLDRVNTVYEGNASNELVLNIAKEIENAYISLYEHTSRVFIPPQDIPYKLDQMILSAKEKGDEIDRMLRTFRSFSAEEGVLPNAGYYEEISEKHSEAAKRWLKKGYWLFGGIVLFFVSILVLVICIFLKGEHPSWEYSEIVCILLIASICIYVLSFCIKNYSNEKHNEIVFKNKARSLKTFISLLEGTSDKETRDQILLYACTAIFGNNTTGFGKRDDTALPPILEFIKLVKGLGK